MSVTLFGAARTRAYRCQWLAEEIGLDYEIVEIGAEAAAAHPALGAVTPFGKVPALLDGELALWESYAINHYLARRYGGTLGPQDLAEEGLMLSWAFLAATALEPAAEVVFLNGFWAPEEERDAARIAPAMQALERPLAALEAHLERAGHLVGERFTVADVDLVSVLGWVAVGGGDLAPYPSTVAWLARCGGRPAARRVLARLGL